jgi:hypothetical protein
LFGIAVEWGGIKGLTTTDPASLYRLCRILGKYQKEIVRFQVLTAASMMFIPDDGGSTHL